MRDRQLCYAGWTTSLRRTYERGNERLLVLCFTVSPPAISIFLGGLCCVWVLLGVLVLLFVFVCFPRFRDQSSSHSKLNDRLSCHGAHGMGGKKKLYKDGPL